MFFDNNELLRTRKRKGTANPLQSHQTLLSLHFRTWRIVRYTVWISELPILTFKPPRSCFVNPPK